MNCCVLVAGSLRAPVPVIHPPLLFLVIWSSLVAPNPINYAEGFGLKKKQIKKNQKKPENQLPLLGAMVTRPLRLGSRVWAVLGGGQQTALGREDFRLVRGSLAEDALR